MTKKKKNKAKETLDTVAVEEVLIQQMTIEQSAEETLEVKVEASTETSEEVVVEAVEDKNLITDINELESALLALIFASPVALGTKKLKNLLSNAGYDVSQLDLVFESLFQSFENKGIQLIKVGGGYQLRTNPKYAELVQKLVEEKPQRLSKSALEVLAIVAYKQPITRADIDHVRGTDSGHLLKGLLEKNLVRTEGHKETAGRPLLYGTSPYFLEVFSLGSLDDLPAIEDFERELKDVDTDAGEGGLVMDADPGFFENSSLDATADRGDYDTPAEVDFEAPDFGEAERALEETH
ncbi:MAG: SMC-Scp complex subunit ScpB [Bdellovibrionota bacterium]